MKSQRLSVFCTPFKITAANQHLATADTSADEIVSDDALSESNAGESDSDVNDTDVTGASNIGILSLREWPDTNVLFEQDVEYCLMRRRLMECVSSNVTMLTNYCRVSCNQPAVVNIVLIRVL